MTPGGASVLGSLGSWQEAGKALLKIGIAYVLTVPIGWESEQEQEATGIRTFPIVGMASCGYLLAIGSDLAAQSRVLQGLITGIGFVGAGAILKERGSVHGTATAASIWNAGVIGASVAMGHNEAALILCLFNIFTLRALLPIKRRMGRNRNGR
jgi:putative Mg2+ transporter-C (MgtC) family protein